MKAGTSAAFFLWTKPQMSLETTEAGLSSPSQVRLAMFNKIMSWINQHKVIYINGNHQNIPLHVRSVKQCYCVHPISLQLKHDSVHTRNEQWMNTHPSLFSCTCYQAVPHAPVRKTASSLSAAPERQFCDGWSVLRRCVGSDCESRILWWRLGQFPNVLFSTQMCRTERASCKQDSSVSYNKDHMS